MAASTRTFAFYLPLDNLPRTFERDGKTHFVWRFRPGQRVRIKVPVERFVVLAADGKTEILPFVLPAGAVVREGPEAFVFVQNGDTFVRTRNRIYQRQKRARGYLLEVPRNRPDDVPRLSAWLAEAALRADLEAAVRAVALFDFAPRVQHGNPQSPSDDEAMSA